MVEWRTGGGRLSLEVEVQKAAPTHHQQLKMESETVSLRTETLQTEEEWRRRVAAVLWCL